MSRYIMLYAVVAIIVLGCQKSSSVAGDSETVDTVTTTGSGTKDSQTPGDSVTSPDSGTDDSASVLDTEDTSTDTVSDTANLPVPIENKWVFIEGGSFEMGFDGPDESFYDKYKPVHAVTVLSFEIQKTEVTVYQYRQCVDEGGCTAPHQSERECADSYNNNWLVPQNVNYPVNCIDHMQATEYCDWIGGRLLSEAEWEYAARGGGQDILFPWGNESPNCDLLAATGEQYIGIPTCWSLGSLPVCSKPTGNSFHELCDMSGNYHEWVADRVHVTSGYQGAPNDSSPWIEDTEYAVVRGSAAFHETYFHQVFIRGSLENDSANSWDTTVRCGKTPE